MEHFNIDGYDLRNMAINASNNLQEKKDFINSLNVFPVPDGDTGTNMSMTFKSAVTEIENINEKSISQVAKKLSKGALMGARGNSGVILSQIFRGLAKGLEGKDEVDALEFAKSIEEGSKAAYKAVMRPTEGTILTIIRTAGEKAISIKETDVVKLLKEVCEHCEVVLDKTPEMLPALKESKVVDAGGMGLLVIFQGMYEALNKNIEAKVEEHKPSEGTVNKSAQASIKSEDIKFGYCTEFFVLTKGAGEKAQGLKELYEPVGDSLIVVGVDDIIKVHVHTNDPGFVLSQAVQLGELSKVKIDNMREQHRQILELEYASTDDTEENSLEQDNAEKEFAFVSVSMGDGIKKIFENLGVDSVIEGGQTMNPSTQDILEHINKLNSNNIFVFPNNKNIIMAAEQAADLSEKNVIVIPTKSIPQGVTAITMFDGSKTVEANIEVMKDVISKVSTGNVTYAVRDTEIDGKIIKEGNILGLIDNKINEVGKDIYEICDKLISNMVNEDSELITIFYGKDCDEEKVEEFVSELENKYSDIDIQSYSGEQPLYYFIISVE